MLIVVALCFTHQSTSSPAKAFAVEPVSCRPLPIAAMRASDAATMPSTT